MKPNNYICAELTEKIKATHNKPMADTINGALGRMAAVAMMLTFRVSSKHEWTDERAMLMSSVTRCKHCRVKKDIFLHD